MADIERAMSSARPMTRRRLDAGRRLELVERHDRAGPHVDDLAADAEILEHAFEQAGILLERVARHRHAVGLAGSASSSSGGCS